MTAIRHYGEAAARRQVLPEACRERVTLLTRQVERLAAVPATGRAVGEVAEVATDTADLMTALSWWATDLALLAGDAEQTAMQLEAGDLNPAECGWLAMELARLTRHLTHLDVRTGDR